MEIVWDPQKAATNYQKHKVRFSDAEPVFFDPLALTKEEQFVGGGQRFVTLGYDAIGRILTVVFTNRDDTIRLISARKATSSERKHYEEGI